MVTIPRYNRAFTITPSDSTDFGPCGKGTGTSANLTDAVYVGGAGDVAVVFEDGAVFTFKAVPVGTTIPVRARRINSTNTTATLLVGLNQI